MDDTVHVACCFDGRLELQFLVLAGSIKRRLPGGRRVVLHALHSDPLVHAPAFWRGLEGGGFEVCFHPVENPYVGRFDIPATLIRFLLPGLLADVDRVLYLDTDIIVLEDITPLYDTDLQGHALAAVLDYACTAVYPQRGWHIPAGQRDWEVLEFLGGVLQLTDWKAYFNSGVMVMDLVRFREENIIDRALQFLETTRNAHFLVDQDSLNHVLDGAFARLDYRWNVNAVTRDGARFEGAAPELAHITDLWQGAPSILHFCGTEKPWNPVARGTMWDGYFWREAAECGVFPLLLGAYLKRCEEQGLTRLQPAASLLAQGKPGFLMSQLEAHALRFGDIPEVAAAGANFAAELDRAAAKWSGPEPLPISVGSFKNKGGIPEGGSLMFLLAEADGHVVYGPYAGYPPGSYEAVLEISFRADPGNGHTNGKMREPGRLVIEAVLDADRFLAQRTLSTSEALCKSSRTLHFTIDGSGAMLEFRIHATGFTGGELLFSGVTLRRSEVE